MVQVPLAEHHKMVQRFVLDRFHDPLAVRIGVWTLGRQVNQLHVIRPKDLIELLRELRVPVPDQVSRRAVLLLDHGAHVPGLLGDPGGIRMGRPLRDPNSSAPGVDKHQKVHVHQTLHRPDLLGEEVAGVKCAGMPLHELIPCLRSGEAVFSPIVPGHPLVHYGLPADWSFWSRIDGDHLLRCDEVVVLMLAGWDHSKGIREEVRLATALGKPVRYVAPVPTEPRAIPPTLAHVAAGLDGADVGPTHERTPPRRGTWGVGGTGEASLPTRPGGLADDLLEVPAPEFDLVWGGGADRMDFNRDVAPTAAVRRRCGRRVRPRRRPERSGCGGRRSSTSTRTTASRRTK